MAANWPVASLLNGRAEFCRPPKIAQNVVSMEENALVSYDFSCYTEYCLISFNP